MKQMTVFLAMIALCGRAVAVSVEAEQVCADFLQDSMSLSYGPTKVIEKLSFYLADEAWSTVFPARNTKGSRITAADTLVTVKSEKNAVADAEIIYTIRSDGMGVKIRAEVQPGTQAHFAVCDMFLSKPLFAGAEVKRAGQASLRLDPEKWDTIPVDEVTLATADGDWVFNVTGDGSAHWALRSVCDRTWGADELKTFSLLYQVTGIPETGMTVNLGIDVRFIPRPGYLASLNRLYDEKVSSYLLELLNKYGVSRPVAALPADPTERAVCLTTELCNVSSRLRPDRIDPRAGVVIPAPKSYVKGTGMFAVPADLRLVCSPVHEGAIEVLTEDLSCFGVNVKRSDPETVSPRGWFPALFGHRSRAAKGSGPSLLMGVPARDPFVQGACESLGISLTGPVSQPEGYVLVVKPEVVLIAGADDAGVLYGVQTLRQLLRAGEAGAEIPVVEIRDWPDLAVRGFYVEGAGRNAGSEELRRLIRNVYSQFRANTLLLEIRWPEFRWVSHPELANEKSLPLAELAALANYARRYHLDVVPAVFTYGKVGNDLVRAHPEIAEVAPGTVTSGNMAYCPNKPESYALVFDLFEEILSATQCRCMHIGHDEIKGMALCPVCRAIPPADLFANDVNRLATWLADRQVETMIWGDFLLDRERWAPLGVDAANSGNPAYGGHDVAPAINKIRKDVIIADWHYGNAKAYPTLNYFAENGFRAIGCPWHKSVNNYWITQSVHDANQRGVVVTDWGFLATRSTAADSIVSVACAWNLAMPEPGELTWSPEDVFAAAVLPKGRPSARFEAKCVPVPLGGTANRNLQGSEDAWFGSSIRHALVLPPPGPQRFFGVDYLLGEKCVVVGNRKSDQEVTAESGAISVNALVRSLIFLQAMSVAEPAVGLRRYGYYRITYENGQTVDLPIDGRNITHWLSRAPRKNPWMPWKYGHTWDTVLAWEGCTRSGEPVNFQAYEWQNPVPDEPIRSVVMVAGQDVPGLKLALVALTAVQ